MIRAIAAWTAATALAVGAAASAAEQDPPPILRNLRAASNALEANDCRGALTAIGKVRKASDFAALPDQLRLVSLQIAAICEGMTDQAADAYSDALAATAFAESEDYMWRLRLGYELDAKRLDAAVATVEAMSNGRGAALSAIPIGWLWQLHRLLDDAKATPLRRRLLAVLGADTYQPGNPGSGNARFRYRYAALLFDAGEKPAALSVARAIDEPGTMIDLSLDPRFRSLFPGDPPVRQATESALARMRETAARNPDHLSPVIQIATYLRALGRPQEALAALETMHARVVGSDKLEDRDEQAVWWWDELERARKMAGDDPGAILALQQGMMLTESGGANVSQTINLAQFQLELGRPADALKTLVAFGDGKRKTSPFGEMQVVATRACATKRTGAVPAAADIDYAKAHVADAPAAQTDLLLCLGNLDGAAAAMIARLDNADQRTAALRDLSTFAPPPAARTPNAIAVARRSLAARPDIQAAIARAGGIRRFDIQDVEM